MDKKGGRKGVEGKRTYKREKKYSEAREWHGKAPGAHAGEHTQTRHTRMTSGKGVR